MSHTHHHDIDFKTAFTVTKEANSQVKIAGEIPFSELEAERSTAIKKLGKNVSLAGFRKGHIPESVLVKQLGAMNILIEMAERAIAHMYPHILETHKIDAIGHPKIEITKIAEGNPLGFTAVVAIVPTFTLPNYQALAKTINGNKESVEVTDAEVETQINDILRRKIAYERLQAKAQNKPDASETTPETEPKEIIETEADLAKLPLPALTDELVATLGQPGQFSNVADFRAKIREHLEIEKKRETEAKHRSNLTDTIIGATTIELPPVIVDSELNQMLAQMNEDLERANLKMEDYLSHIKKTKADLLKDWTPAAEKRAKLQLILNEIAREEKIMPETPAVEAKVAELLEQYKDADKNSVTIYVTSILRNEAVMKLLESY